MSRKYTETELIELLVKKAAELGRSPSSKEMPQRLAILRCFGSHNKALEIAGLSPHESYYQKYTKDELIRILQNKAEELGRSPKFKEVPQRQSIVNHFGSFNNALRTAGLTPYPIRRYTEEELINALKDKASELGRTPRTRDMRCRDAIRNHFGSFNKALELAGLKINKKKRRNT
ncbi:homing endonuclease associated repeat-containing protein (plasmid) [Bacillus safensis subsp. safensis]|uniref:homing endonuclease associated repeat-containing protein n=1 Tax=Bacillus safensis TaxID=561879 RepID=UPI0037C1717A